MRGCGRVVLIGLGAAVTTLTVASCTTSVDGTPARSADSPPGSVDVSQLDTGNYPTAPLPPFGNAGSTGKGALIEGARLADHLVGPWEADPKLTASDGRGAAIIKDATAVPLVVHEKIAAAAGDHGFVTGFFAQRANAAPRDTSLMNAVLLFPDAAAASAAASDFSDRALDPETVINTDPAPTTIPGHPQVRAVTYSYGGGWTTVQAITAHGPYVFVQRAVTTLGIDPGAALLAKTLELQASTIDEFKPTAPQELANLPVDPTGLLARTLPDTAKPTPVVNNMVYGPHAALQFLTEPASTATLFEETDTDLMSKGGANVYRAANAQGAQRIVDTFVAEVKAAGSATDGVKMLPDSRCLKVGERFWCMATADRYAIEVDSSQLADAHQRVAAQYKMLMAT